MKCPARVWILFSCTVSLAVFLATPVQATEEGEAEASALAARPGSRWFPPRLTRGDWVYLPKVSWTSQQGFGVGGHLQRPFAMRGEGHDLDMSIRGRYTLEGQGQLELSLDHQAGPISIKTKATYDSLPQRFWGIGGNTPPSAEEEYRPESYRIYLELFRRAVSHLRVGVRYEFEHLRILESEPGGLLDSANIPGTAAAPASGWGLLLDWDTRDNRYSPRSGQYFQSFAMFFDDELGSEQTFNLYNLDLRVYTPVGSRNVLATQFFVYDSRGGAPFWRLAALGGRAHTRGYRKGRYLEQVLAAFQAELRTTVTDWFGIVAFAGLGDVASDATKFQLETMRPTLGAGLRFTVGSRKDVKVRFDAAFGEDSARFYASLGEAF